MQLSGGEAEWHLTGALAKFWCGVAWVVFVAGAEAQ